MTDQPTGIGPITPIRCPEPGCYWSVHGVPDKYAESRARILAEHAAAEHGEQQPTAPPAADLRDRIRRAICEASGFTWLPDELMEPDEYGEHADAVLAVLPTSGPCSCGGRFPLHHLHADTHEPAPADQAAACPECGDAGACNGGPCPLADRRARYAAAIAAAACQGDCADTEEECEQRRVQPVVWQGGVLTEVMGRPEVLADAVMAVADAEQQEMANAAVRFNAALMRQNEKLRAEVERLRTTRATTFRDAAEVAVRAARGCGESETGQYAASVAAGIGRDLRRLADEAQQPETETRSWSCAHCGTTIRHVVGTLAAWWVHDLGGKTACYPQQKCSTVAAPAPTEEPTR